MNAHLYKERKSGPPAKAMELLRLPVERPYDTLTIGQK